MACARGVPAQGGRRAYQRSCETVCASKNYHVRMCQLCKDIMDKERLSHLYVPIAPYDGGMWDTSRKHLRHI